MSMFGLFRRAGSAPVARERLQILLAHERALIGQTDLVGVLREEIRAVIGRHVSIADGAPEAYWYRPVAREETIGDVRHSTYLTVRIDRAAAPARS